VSVCPEYECIKYCIKIGKMASDTFHSCKIAFGNDILNRAVMAPSTLTENNTGSKLLVTI
jgi:hypothetical protein